MTIYDKIKSKLEDHLDFRERRYRGKYLAILALRDLGLEMKYKEGRQLSMEEMLDFTRKYDSHRHEWDAVMRDYPNLQGEDYEDGKMLAQEKQIEFGYESGFTQTSKMFK